MAEVKELVRLRPRWSRVHVALRCLLVGLMVYLPLVTGDETFVYQYDPETKQQSSVWLFQGQAPLLDSNKREAPTNK